MKLKLILLFLLAIPGIIAAQEISFSAQAPKQVYVGQRFQLTFTINEDGNNFMGPEITNFNILSGPMMSSGQNIMNINGKLEYSSTSSYSFILEAIKPGTFTIPQAIVSVKGKRYMSNTTTITVLNQTQRSTQQPPGNNQPQAHPCAQEQNNTVEIAVPVQNRSLCIDKLRPFYYTAKPFEKYIKAVKTNPRLRCDESRRDAKSCLANN